MKPPSVYTDLDRNEKVPNPGVGTIVRLQRCFFKIMAEVWVVKCQCVKPDCRGGTRKYQLMPLEPVSEHLNPGWIQEPG